MEEQRIELSKADPRIERLIKLANYNGRKPIKVIARVNCSLNDYWSDGSRYYAHFATLDGRGVSDQVVGFIQQARGNPYNLRMGSAELKPGLVLVECPIFQGKTLPPRIYFHPDDYQKLFQS
jgi:hypothetical protein